MILTLYESGAWRLSIFQPSWCPNQTPAYTRLLRACNLLTHENWTFLQNTPAGFQSIPTTPFRRPFNRYCSAEHQGRAYFNGHLNLILTANVLLKITIFFTAGIGCGQGREYFDASVTFIYKIKYE